MDYLDDVSTKTAGLTTAKMLFNSVVSTSDAKFCMFDISNMYLNTPLDDYQYMRFNVKDVPPEVINLYNLHNKIIPDGWLYCKIQRAIYGLNEAGKLANIQLQKLFATEGYYPCLFTQELFRHETRDITFSLVVDDFGVKYINQKDEEHLEPVIKKNYPMKTDWDGDYYLGMTLKWNYDKTHNKRLVKFSMPGYIKEPLIKFQHFTTKQQFSASPYSESTYGKKIQYVTINNVTFTPE